MGGCFLIYVVDLKHLLVGFLAGLSTRTPLPRLHATSSQWERGSFQTIMNIDPGEGFRLLDPDERVKESDERWWGTSEGTDQYWRSFYLDDGKLARDCGVPIRRDATVPRYFPRSERCENCEFYAYGGGWNGSCKRHAPTLVMNPKRTNYRDEIIRESAFPQTHIYFWCGDWKQKTHYP